MQRVESGDYQGGGVERPYPHVGIHPAATVGKQVGTKVEREDLIQVATRVYESAQNVLGAKDVGERVLCV
jgi:hypothetical protein